MKYKQVSNYISLLELAITKMQNKQKGQNHPSAKLKKTDILEIKRLLEMGLTQMEISKQFNVCRSNISHIKSGRNWNSYKYHKVK